MLKKPLTAHYFVVSWLKMLIYWYINSAFPLKTPRTALARDFFNTLLDIVPDRVIEWNRRRMHCFLVQVFYVLKIELGKASSKGDLAL